MSIAVANVVAPVFVVMRYPLMKGVGPMPRVQPGDGERFEIRLGEQGTGLSWLPTPSGQRRLVIDHRE